MPGKRRSRKKRASRSIRSKPGVEQRGEDRSFGSGLDEIGFRPLGRRILVSKHPSKASEPEQSSETGTVASEAADRPASYTDDPLGYDTSEPSWVRKAVEDALSGANKDAIEK